MPLEARQVTAPHGNVQSALFVLGTLDILPHKISESFNAVHTSEMPDAQVALSWTLSKPSTLGTAVVLELRSC